MQMYSQDNHKSTLAITAKNLCISFGTTHVINHVSFAIPKNTINAIIGPNGSGKTTLIKAILGLQSYGGELQVFGQKPGKQKSIIGYVPQRFDFDRSIPMTAIEFLNWTNKNQEKDHIADIWTKVGLKNSVEKTLVGQLSGGQLQRLLLAQALIQKPDLLILDEPDANIDSSGERQLEDILKEYTKQGGTVILISHDISFVARSVEYVICINSDLICSGPPKTTLTQKNIDSLFAGTQPYHHHH